MSLVTFYLVLGTIFNLLWQILYATVQIFLVTKGQILYKKIKPSDHTGRDVATVRRINKNSFAVISGKNLKIKT